MITLTSNIEDDSPSLQSLLPSIGIHPNLSQLPERYSRRLLASANVNGLVIGTDLDSREKDLESALNWIRQEIILMKEQDKFLLKQFINLRTTILQLRCMYELHSSQSDVSSIDGSTCSLNNARIRFRHHKIDKPGSSIMDITQKTKSLIALPDPVDVKTLKWKSDEII